MTLPATSERKPTKARMPDWLLRQIEETTGGFRNGRWRHCPACGMLTISGLDADSCAFQVNVDPTPLQPHEERFCAIQGRRTYAIEIIGSKLILNHRDPYAIGRPSNYRILPTHQCGMRYSSFLLKPPENSEDEQACPF